MAKSTDSTSPALAFLELSSISRGLFLTDIIVKKAEVEIIYSQPISSGKHVVLFFGDVAAVDESYRAAVELSESCILKQVMIPGVHPGLVPFLSKSQAESGASQKKKRVDDSVAIVESTTLAGAILAADRALKSAQVALFRMRLGQGIGGKAYFVLTGRLEEVQAAVLASEECLKEMQCLARTDLIANPMGEALAHF